MEAYGRNGPLATPNPPTTLPAFALPRRKKLFKGYRFGPEPTRPHPIPPLFALSPPSDGEKIGGTDLDLRLPPCPLFSPFSRKENFVGPSI
jgi:hypothetical protein